MELSPDEIDKFYRDGFVFGVEFLGNTEVDLIKACYMDTMRRLSCEGGLENVQSGKDLSDDHQVYQIRTAHLQHPIFNMLIHDSRLLDIVESFIGPDIRLIHFQGLYKPAYSGGEVGWHQDNYYFDVADNRTVTVWLALDDTTVENGCMWYLPGRHHERIEHKQLWDISKKKGFYFVIPDIDTSGAIPAEVKKGSLAIHHCLMPHRSLKNETDLPRRAIAMHFMDATMPDSPMLKILPKGATPLLRKRKVEPD